MKIAEFRKELDTKAAVVILIGMSGAGKSTFANEVAGEDTHMVLSSDHMRYLLTGDAENQEVSADVFDVLKRMCKARSEFGQTSLLDATHLRYEYRQPYFEVNAALPVYYVFVKASPATCAARQEQRDRQVPQWVLDRQEETLKESLGSIQHEPFDRLYIYDSGNDTLSLAFAKDSLDTDGEES